MTCYQCEKSKTCEPYNRAINNKLDYTDLYLCFHSVKKGCPEGYDKENPCYPCMDDGCENCQRNKDGWCDYFNESCEDAYLIDCPCKVEATE